MIQTIIPQSKEEWLKLRMNDITSTDAAALFGLSPYCTKFELWHRKKRGEVVEFQENKRMKWGTALQDTIAAQIATDKGWKVRRMDEYMRDDELRAGSSFDFSIEEIKNGEKTSDGYICDGGLKPGLLEIKNVDGLQYRDKWDENESPLHIEMQVQHQLMVSGREYAYIGALVGGNDEHLIFRKRDESVIAELRRAIVDFWKSIEENNPPNPDFTVDAKFIAKLYGYAEPNKIMDARGNEQITALAERYKEYGDAEREAKKNKDAIKSELLTLIGDAEKVTGDRFTISAGMVAEADISYTRQAYRTFKTTWKKK